MMKRKALGKGLGSLIPEIPAAAAPELLRYLDPESMTPNRFQPRETFDEADLQSLTESIRRTESAARRRPTCRGRRYEIIAGERRWRPLGAPASRESRSWSRRSPTTGPRAGAGREPPEARSRPARRGEGFRLLSERFDLTQDQIAERVGKSRSAVANTLRILKLPAGVQDLIKSGKLTRGHARALLALEGEAQILSLAARLVVDEQLNVRTAEAETRTAPGRKRPARETPCRIPTSGPHREAPEPARHESVDRHGVGGKGRIAIQFDSDEELSAAVRWADDRPFLRQNTFSARENINSSGPHHCHPRNVIGDVSYEVR